MKKIALLFSLFIFLLVSCSTEELQTENTDFVASEMLSNKEIKENPSILYSVKFQKINAINKETNEKGIFYLKKTQSSTGKVTETRGLWYSGGDCAIYGTIYTDDVSGDSFFVPAGAATQYLMNVCGLSNVAKFKKSK
jgi:ribosomal protein L23